MNILWVNKKSSFFGGCEYYIFNTVKHLRDRGIQCFLIYDPLLQSDPAYLCGFDAAFAACSLQRQIEDLKPDLIFIHQADPFLVQELKKFRIPIIRFFHDHSLFCMRETKLPLFSNKPCGNAAGCTCHPLGFTLVREKNPLGIGVRTTVEFRRRLNIHRNLNGYIVPSEYMAAHVASYGFAPEKIHTIPLYAEEVKEPQTDRRDLHQLLFVGQLVRGKGVDIAIKALARLPESYHLTIIGEGPQGHIYLKLAEKLEVSRRIQFLGSVQQNKLEKWYERAFCTLLPTRTPETFGLIGPESMRFGTPVIGTSLGGVQEWLIPDVTGISVLPNSEKQIVEGIQRLQSDPSFYEVLCSNCKMFYGLKFRPQYHIEKLLQCFAAIVDSCHTKDVRYALKGSKEFNLYIEDVLERIREALKSEIPYRAVMLIGGYGKGEGGIEIGQGKELLHNNLDLLLIIPSMREKQIGHLKSKIEQKLFKIGLKEQIGIDFSIVTESKLRNSSQKLIWYEMMYGGRCLLGDAQFVAHLPFSNVQSLDPLDMLEFLRNRATLLVINEWLLDQHVTLSDPLKRVFIKHIMKAVIGAGDAYLFFLGAYHWSYIEKMHRISANPQIDTRFKNLYEEAANFRFEACYDSYLSVDLNIWLSKVQDVICSIYLDCERLRLKASSLSWHQYLEQNLQESFWQGWTSIKGLGTKLQGVLNLPAVTFGKRWIHRLSFYLLSPRQRLSLLFPYVAFSLKDEHVHKLLPCYLASQDGSAKSLREAYLQLWGIWGDSNFYRSLEEWSKKEEDV